MQRAALSLFKAKSGQAKTNGKQLQAGCYMQTVYNETFYDQQSEGSLRSARFVVPQIVTLYRPKYIADIGGGIGTWSKAFEECGVEATCFDGVYVDKSRVMCKRFMSIDLETPFTFSNEYDIAICLEVAEHLQPIRAEGFIHDLCTIAPVIVFSAATIGQGGTNHLNEQPHHYWHGLFKENGYEVDLKLRARIQSWHEIEPFYRNNIFTYIRTNNENPL